MFSEVLGSNEVIHLLYSANIFKYNYTTNTTTKCSQRLEVAMKVYISYIQQIFPNTNTTTNTITNCFQSMEVAMQLYIFYNQRIFKYNFNYKLISEVGGSTKVTHLLYPVNIFREK